MAESVARFPRLGAAGSSSEHESARVPSGTERSFVFVGSASRLKEQRSAISRVTPKRDTGFHVAAAEENAMMPNTVVAYA